MPSRPDRYAVIGNPIAHSRSPEIHGHFARATGQSLTYERLLAPVGGFAEAVDAFRAEGGRGLNVTLPFKVDAFAYARRRSLRAEVAGAVNCLAFEGQDAYGDNTDGAGLVADLTGRLAVMLDGASVLLLGAGGASRGVVQPLLEAGVSRLVVANRTASRARELVEALSQRLADSMPAVMRLSGCGLDELPVQDTFDLVVNATSGGLGGEPVAIAPALLGRAALAYDMVYGAAPTPFMQQARAAGCPRVSDGLGMLVEQAAESFHLWRGLRPETAPVFDALRAALDSQARG
jgi:shikimate dehydrogenase